MKCFLVFTVLAIASPCVLGVELSVRNNCPQEIWLATMPNFGVADLPDGTVYLNTGAEYTYSIPSEGWAGRFWPKVGCDASGWNCEFGDSSPPCPANGCQPPADTKVEFFFPSLPPNGDSWYDVSLVDGWSLPMRIAPRVEENGACVSTSCTMSLDDCPMNEPNGLGDLGVYVNGKKVACLSPCKKWNYPAPWGLGISELEEPGVWYCCPTPPIEPAACSSGPMLHTAYVGIVHAKCPSAYSYAYDDAAGLHNCPGGTSFDVTLCP